MKNLFLAALLAVTIAGSAFATDENKISSVVLNSFKVDFKNADNVTWISTADYAKASFTANHRKMEAFYNLRGDIIAVSKYIETDELPLSTKRFLGKKYNSYITKEAIQFDGMGETSYYISVENDNEALILKVNENEDVSIFKKTKK